MIDIGLRKPHFAFGLPLVRVVAICQMFILASFASYSKAAENSDPSTWKPGQVLSEKVKDLGNGYSEIHRSVVNAPGHWEGVGHFVFIYFKKVPLCQCSANEISISPDGRYAIFAKETDGSLTLFNAETSATRTITTKYVGTPHTADWELKRGEAIVHVRKWVKEKNDYDEMKISIPLLAPLK